MRIHLRRVPTESEIKKLVAEIRTLLEVDQIIMSSALNGKPWFDVTLRPSAQGRTIKNKIQEKVKRVSRDLAK